MFARLTQHITELEQAHAQRAAAEQRAARLEGVTCKAQTVVDQSYIVGAEGWENVNDLTVPASWENALYELQAALAPTAAPAAGEDEAG
jgi:hypothetical protein